MSTVTQAPNSTAPNIDAPPRMKAVASAAKLSVPRYGELLKKFAPKVIETGEENRLALRIVERLMSIGRRPRLIGGGDRIAELARGIGRPVRTEGISGGGGSAKGDSARSDGA